MAGQRAGSCKNLIERVTILTSEGEDGKPITAAMLLGHLSDDASTQRMTDSSVASTAPGRNLRDARSEFEKGVYSPPPPPPPPPLKTLKEQEWNNSLTAQTLGIERSHLHSKNNSYGIETKE